MLLGLHAPSNDARETMLTARRSVDLGPEPTVLIYAPLLLPLLMPASHGTRGGRLREITLTPQYRRHLHEAGGWALGVVVDLGGSLHSKSSSRHVDKWLERMVDWAYTHGEKLYWTTLAVLSIQRRFKLSAPLLRCTWAAIKSWRLLQPIQPRVPMTYYVLRCVLVTCLGRVCAVHGPSRLEWMSVMLALWVAFEGMLRPGEVDRLVCGDLCFPEHAELSEGVGLVINIRQAKTRRVWANQFVIIRCPRLIAWLQWWCVGLRKRDRLLQVSKRKWGLMLKEILESLSLQTCGMTLASLRGGGACHMFKTTQNFAVLQFSGRWRRPETLHHYLQDALAVHALANAPPQAKELLELAFEHVDSLSHPPLWARARLLERSP